MGAFLSQISGSKKRRQNALTRKGGPNVSMMDTKLPRGPSQHTLKRVTKVKPKVDRRCSKCSKAIPESVQIYWNPLEPDEKSKMWCKSCFPYWDNHSSGKMVAHQKKAKVSQMKQKTTAHKATVWRYSHFEYDQPGESSFAINEITSTSVGFSSNIGDEWHGRRVRRRFKPGFAQAGGYRAMLEKRKHRLLPMVWRQITDLPDFECEECKVTRLERWILTVHNGVARLSCLKCRKGLYDGARKTKDAGRSRALCLRPLTARHAR
ncbi:uncharacterized protein BO95DRAFT_508738 [Aspergillus brunneoviolaceus CBS 621.78]|uniref:Uncharacterized protein n=1 Tax=Aspergillus brunneoviolaceus CBS 621.78 TaxID=1450534 RepID=A0ACD1FUL4_9EURO|nr:hypothetical protein BO95DRAFT_508738 [Aspergillus brunneoviolaceus CBS 621.78]RAH40621.1 hypothetical protein BO95DRAFT_508738 [Aspergillus brunneoviolaceus CBS 621.78]